MLRKQRHLQTNVLQVTQIDQIGAQFRVILRHAVAGGGWLIDTAESADVRAYEDKLPPRHRI